MPARWWVHYVEPLAEEKLAGVICEYISLYRFKTGPRVLLCIGTDRLTGDALGPLVGTKLAASCGHSFHVYGTLAEPVHALNLRTKLEEIYSKHDNVLVIAVDASLGDSKNVGLITVGTGPIRPGAGVEKVLPHVGHVHITGVVSTGGLGELLNTRLHLVMSQAEVIAAALLRVARAEELTKVLRSDGSSAEGA
ncbi:MAG: spore protease YyaC [Bacillota bacterium]